MSPTKKLCFVVGPIGRTGTPERTHADWLNEGIIKPLFREHFSYFATARADEISVPGMIDAQVINHLFDADLVISDMSFRNANAFYEMGIRHAVQKPIIHMYRTGEDIPFDVQPYRAIEFSVEHPSDLVRARDRLKAAVEQSIGPAYKPDNPVIRARGLVELEKNATAPEKLLLDRFSSLEARLARMETLGAPRSRLKKPAFAPYSVWIKTKPELGEDHFSTLVKDLARVFPIKRISRNEDVITINTDYPNEELIKYINTIMKVNYDWIESASDIPF